MKLEDNLLIQINGGGLTAAYLNAAARAVTTILELGRTLGSTIKRAISKNFC